MRQCRVLDRIEQVGGLTLLVVEGDENSGLFTRILITIGSLCSIHRRVFEERSASIPLTRTVTRSRCLWMLLFAASCGVVVSTPEEDKTDAFEDQRLAVSDSVPLSSTHAWSEAVVMADVSSRQVAYGGRNIGTRRVWKVRHEIVFSGAADSWSHPLGDVQTTSSKDTLLDLSQARFELRPAPDGACVAWKEEGMNSWGYAWVRQDTIACPHILGAAPEADPCQNAHTVDTLARAILGIEADAGSAL